MLFIEASAENNAVGAQKASQRKGLSLTILVYRHCRASYELFAHFY